MATLPDTAKPIKRRNRAATMERILRAAGEVMAEVGVHKAGINAVAVQAGVNKVLIYRYFGGWNGVIEAFVHRGFFLSLFSERGLDAVPINPPAEARYQHWQALLSNVLFELRDRTVARELIRWEMANGQTELARRLAHLRNETFSRAFTKLGLTGLSDPSATTALLWGGMAYLALSSDSPSAVINVDLGAISSWERIETALRRLVIHQGVW